VTEADPAPAVEDGARAHVEVAAGVDAVAVLEVDAAVDEREAAEAVKEQAVEDVAEHEADEAGDRTQEHADELLGPHDRQLPHREVAEEAPDETAHRRLNHRAAPPRASRRAGPGSRGTAGVPGAGGGVVRPASAQDRTPRARARRTRG